MTTPNLKFDKSVAVPTEQVDDGERCWLFPVSWSSEQAVAFLAASEEEHEEDTRLALLEAEAYEPSRVIAAKKKEIAEKRASRVTAERDREEDAIFEAAATERGGEHRVMRVRTPEGSIMLRPQTSAEMDRIAKRVNADGMKDADILIIAREGLCATVIHPPRKRFDEIVELYPGLWTSLYQARDKLVSGVVEELEKKA